MILTKGPQTFASNEELRLKTEPTNDTFANEGVSFMSLGPFEDQTRTSLRVTISGDWRFRSFVVEEIKFGNESRSRVDPAYYFSISELCKGIRTSCDFYSVNWIKHDLFELVGVSGVILIRWHGDGHLSVESTSTRYHNAPDWYSLLIPSDWEPFEDNGVLTHFVTPSDPHLSFNVRRMTAYCGASLEDVLTSWESSIISGNNKYDIKNLRRTLINGFPAIEVANLLSDKYRELLIFVQCDDVIFRILTQLDDETERAVRRVLGSFKPLNEP